MHSGARSCIHRTYQIAWFDSASAPDNLLVSNEDEAREAKRGLWALPLEERVPPWEWRKEQR